MQPEVFGPGVGHLGDAKHSCELGVKGGEGCGLYICEREFPCGRGDEGGAALGLGTFGIGAVLPKLLGPAFELWLS